MTALRAMLATPVAPMNVAATERGLVAIEILTPSDLFGARLERRIHESVETAGRHGSRNAAEHLGTAIDQLRAYFDGRTKSFDLTLDFRGRPDWDERVLLGVRAIPFGEVSSYGRIARRIGRPGAARAVGGAVGRNPVAIVIPCHRVISGEGSIGGYGGDWWGGRERLLQVKRDLLRLEGIELPVRRFAD